MTSATLRTMIVTLLLLALIAAGDIGVHSAAATRLAALLHLHAPHPLEHLFWDTEPYADGINLYHAGKSPYDPADVTNILPFAYPPLFAMAGSALENALPQPWGFRLYIAVYLGCLVSLTLILAAAFLSGLRRGQRITLLCLAPIAAFMSTVFWSGNIHLVWYSLALLAALPGLRRNRWPWFYSVTLLATLNQPVFLALLLLPLFAGSGQYLASAVTAALSAAGYGAQMLFVSALYAQFRATVANHLAASHDFGQSLFGIGVFLLQGMHLPGVLLAGAIQVAFSCGIVVALIVISRRIPKDDKRWLALLALAIILINPRVMPYDAAVGLIPGAFFFVQSRRLLWAWSVALMTTVASILLHGHVGFTLLLLVPFVLALRSMLARPAAQADLSVCADDPALALD